MHVVSPYSLRVVAIAHLNEIILVVVHDLGLRLGSLLTRRHCRATSMWRRVHPAAGRRHDADGSGCVFVMGGVVLIVVGFVSYYTYGFDYTWRRVCGVWCFDGCSGRWSRTCGLVVYGCI